MKNREASVGVCGAIVGVLLGAGSVSYSQGVSSSLLGSVLSGAIPYTYVTTEFEDVYRKQAHAAAIPVATTLAPEQRESCLTKVKIVEELRSSILLLVPGRPIDDLVKYSMNKVFDSYIGNCMPVQAEVLQQLQPAVQPVQQAAPVEEEQTPPDYSRCEKLSGARYTSCIGAVRDNIPYKPNMY